MQTYSAFLGPIFAVLVADYYFIRGRNLNLGELYDENGPFRGVNRAGIAASLVGEAGALSFAAVSWYASLLPAGLTYWLLRKNRSACKRFLEN